MSVARKSAHGYHVCYCSHLSRSRLSPSRTLSLTLCSLRIPAVSGQHGRKMPVKVQTFATYQAGAWYCCSLVNRLNMVEKKVEGEYHSVWLFLVVYRVQSVFIAPDYTHIYRHMEISVQCHLQAAVILHWITLRLSIFLNTFLIHLVLLGKLVQFASEMVKPRYQTFRFKKSRESCGWPLSFISADLHACECVSVWLWVGVSLFLFLDPPLVQRKTPSCDSSLLRTVRRREREKVCVCLQPCASVCLTIDSHAISWWIFIGSRLCDMGLYISFYGPLLSYLILPLTSPLASSSPLQLFVDTRLFPLVFADSLEFSRVRERNPETFSHFSC